MAEVLAVLGAFSSSLQIVECTAKIVSRTHKLVHGAHDTLQEHDRLEALANGYRSLGATSSGLTGSPNVLGPDASTSKDLTEDNQAKDSDILADDYEKLHREVDRLKVHTRTEADEVISRLGSQCEAESQRLLEQLGALSIDPGAKGGKRLASALKVAIKSLHKRREVNKCRQNLQELNGQLATAILQSLYGGLQSSDLGLGNDGPDESNNTEKILKLLQGAKQDFIIASLWFDDFTARQDAVDSAYPSTYLWALENDFKLRTWLREGNSIFWITGKAGSGKSTLIKFLCEHREVGSLLAQWGSVQHLVISSFFFWYAGTRLQKSIVGLLRTILHQIISCDRTLAEVAFPDQFNAFDPHLLKNSHPKSWTQEDLVAGLKLIASHKVVSTARKKFCLFIDGLDEYLGDHLELVALLNDLVLNPDMKLCVSSRPWNAFRNTFGTETPQLCLEDLSRTDIHSYTKSSIYQALQRCSTTQPPKNEAETQALVDDIVIKADGVFLWVVLVVRSVIRGLAEGDPIFMLRHRVEEFPADLESFFESTLSRVESVYKAQTCQALKLAFIFAQEGGEMQAISTFIDFWLIGRSPNGLSQPDFPYTLALTQLGQNEVITMLKRTRNMLCSACKDLLCIAKVEHYPLSTKVNFLHRTIYDFLSSDKMQNLLNAGVPAHFTNGRIFHLLNLARNKFKLDEQSRLVAMKQLDPALHTEMLEFTDGSVGSGFLRILTYGNERYTVTPYDLLIRHDGPGPSTISGTVFEQVSSLSIETSHLDLCEKYVEEFEAAICMHQVTDEFCNTLIQRPGRLRTFFSFPWSSIASRCLVLLETLPQLRIQSDGDMRSPLLAALGEDDINRFGLERMNISLIKSVCTLDPASCWHLSSYWNAGANDRVQDNWEILFRKWAVFVSQAGNSCIAEGENAKFVHSLLELAEVILRVSYTKATDRFCAAPTSCSDPGHEHQYHEVGRFLQTHIPEAWLHESLGAEFFTQSEHRKRKRNKGGRHSAKRTRQ